MADDRAALRARLEQSLAKISHAVSELDERERRNAARDADREKAREEAARTGKLGPEWVKIQQRIDLKQTTIDDVFAGRDDSPEARALLTRSRQNLHSAGAELDREPDEGEENPIDEVRKLNAAFEAQLARFRTLDLG
jgi:hypothetical protein